MIRLLISLFFNLYLFRSICQASRVLVVPAHLGASHAKSMYPLAATLAKHGHEVVVLQIIKYETHKAKAPSIPNIQDRFLNVPMAPGEPSVPMLLPPSMLWGKPLIRLPTVMPWEAAGVLCKAVLDNKKLKDEFDKLSKEKWDLVIVDNIFAPCGRLAAEQAKRHSNASIINFGTTILLTNSLEMRGLPIPKASYPTATGPPSGFYYHQHFLSRLYNIYDNFIGDLTIFSLRFREPAWLGLPQTEYTVEAWFSLASDMLMSSISPMLDFTKPISNDIVDLDTDCPAHAELPETYATFINDPNSKGTILFAMGHGVNWDGAPSEVLDSFLKAFSRLSDYRIIWQYATDNEKPRVPDHIRLETWVPQSAILYHPKTKVFISHAGGKSLRESICAAVPLVAMPMFAEQLRNTAIARKKGVARYLDKSNLSPDVVYQTILEVLNNPSIYRNVDKLRYQLAHRIIQPMQLGRFWSEFLIRHDSNMVKKYFRMRNRAQEWYQTENMEISLVFLTTFLILMAVV